MGSKKNKYRVNKRKFSGNQYTNEEKMKVVENDASPLQLNNDQAVIDDVIQNDACCSTSSHKLSEFILSEKASYDSNNFYFFMNFKIMKNVIEMLVSYM